MERNTRAHLMNSRSEFERQAVQYRRYASSNPGGLQLANQTYQSCTHLRQLTLLFQHQMRPQGTANHSKNLHRGH